MYQADYRGKKITVKAPSIFVARQRVASELRIKPNFIYISEAENEKITANPAILAAVLQS
jgi:hypothetical protein